jgi:hypothetical protein
MKTTVHKAQSMGSSKSGGVLDMTIEATETFPGIEDPKASAELHDRDASAIVSAMLTSLPGGTVDAVLRRLLEHRASLLRVRWPE